MERVEGEGKGSCVGIRLATYSQQLKCVALKDKGFGLAHKHSFVMSIDRANCLSITIPFQSDEFTAEDVGVDFIAKLGWETK